MRLGSKTSSEMSFSKDLDDHTDLSFGADKGTIACTGRARAGKMTANVCGSNNLPEEGTTSGAVIITQVRTSRWALLGYDCCSSSFSSFSFSFLPHPSFSFSFSSSPFSSPLLLLPFSFSPASSPFLSSPPLLILPCFFSFFPSPPLLPLLLYLLLMLLPLLLPLMFLLLCAGLLLLRLSLSFV